jgi:riboflavin synthase
MFSGIVTDMGTVESCEMAVEAASLTVKASPGYGDVVIGESIAVNGVCLTVVSHCGPTFTLDVSPETLRATNLGELHPGERVNLERSLRLNDRIGGHLVSGHVDGVGTITAKRSEANAWHLDVRAPKEL